MVEIELSSEAMERLSRAAAKRDTEVASLLKLAVDLFLANESIDGNGAEAGDWIREQSIRIEREMQTYTRQHTRLLKEFGGQYIAMRQGQVIDHDLDEVALSVRIRAAYGKESILITPVLAQPVQEIVLRSPHIEWEP